MGAETALPQQPPVLAVTEPVPDILKPELSPIELQPKVSKEYSSPVMPKIIYPENMPTVVSPVEPVAKEARLRHEADDRVRCPLEPGAGEMRPDPFGAGPLTAKAAVVAVVKREEVEPVARQER